MLTVSRWRDQVSARQPSVSNSQRVVGRIQALAFRARQGRRRQGSNPPTQGYESLQSLSHRTLSSRQVGGVYGFESWGEAESGGHYF